eukprot:gene8311-14274_t
MRNTDKFKLDLFRGLLDIIVRLPLKKYWIVNVYRKKQEYCHYNSLKMPGELSGTQRLIRGKLSKFLNLGLCVTGIIFIIIGVFKSTLLLYIGCALIGASIGGFIRSRLPMTTMIPSTGVHFVYRSELQRNLQAYENGLQNNDSVDRLSVVSALTERTESNESCCIICLIHFKTGQEVRKLPCQHIYHINCIDKWLKMNRLCPTCRSDVTLPNSVKKPSTSNEIEVHAELNIVNNHGNRDEIINQGAVGAPSPNQSVVVSLDNSDMREADIGDDNDVTSSLASSSNGVVIEVDVEGSNTAVAN